MKRRMHAALLSVLALILGTGALVLTTAGTASAGLAGTVTLTPAGGSVNDAPAFTKVSVDQACPANYQDALDINIFLPTGDASTLSSHVTSGAPFSTAPITALPPTTEDFSNGTYVRSIATAFDLLGQTVTDGTYPIQVVCKAADTTKLDTPTFTTFIEIKGSNWAVKQVTPPTVTTLVLTANPAGHQSVSHDVTLTATVTPRSAVGTVTFKNRGLVVSKSDIPVANGVATVKMTGAAGATTTPLTATFTPTDSLAFSSSQDAQSYAFVAEPSLTVLDENQNTLVDTPTLQKGQKILVTALGFLPTDVGSNGENVTLKIDNATAAPDVTSDGSGKIANYAVTLPSNIADGSHSLVLTGATSGIKQTFAFKTGVGSTPSGTPTGTPTDTGTPTVTPTDTSSATPSGTSGAVSGGSSSSGGSLSGGSSSSGGSPSGGTSGGSNGPLAATGATGVIPLSVLAFLLVTGGGYAAYRVRRDGKLLAFGPTPRD